ncbi:hypothetical protein HU200_011160 [Digitaria exilis]|uniref:Nucleotide-diphospho-sugar transferase domain-containing protein n=1 Tax=Digitaria exilis TaxID=1010633 RepID=A0A835FHF1_9POAL|nr:hypothetical protein HU200_011160 [Digitaria exilis]
MAWASQLPPGYSIEWEPTSSEDREEVPTADRTVILTSVNKAWAQPGSLPDLFRQSFLNGEGIERLLNHTLIVAVDAAGLDRCRAVHPHCYLLEVKSANVSAANQFLSKGYLELVWTKLSLRQRVLELGYNYLFTDVDVMWLRDPFRHINLYADVTMSCDGFSGSPESRENSPNTGFYYVKSTGKMAMVPRKARPNGLRGIKRELAARLGVRIAFLDTALFGTFCAFLGGIDDRNKVHELRSVVAAWKNYTGLAQAEKESGRARAARLAKPTPTISHNKAGN